MGLSWVTIQASSWNDWGKLPKSIVLTGDLGGDADPEPHKFEYRHATNPAGPSDMPVLTVSPVPLSHLPQTLFPKAMSLRRVTPAVGEGFTVHICIPDGTTAPPS